MGAGASSLDDASKQKLANDINDTYEAKATTADTKELYEELTALYLKCTGEAVPDTKDTEAMLAEAKAVLAENVEKPAAKFRLSTALSAHLETPDGHETFKIGDVVRAAPPDGGGMKFEGVAVDVQDDNIIVDFGDGEEPVEINRRDVQRVNNGTILERDDVVQAKPPGSPCFCLGKIVAMNNDGTYDIAYEGTDEIDANVDVQYIRKVGSGRSSLVKKFRHAVHSISAVRAFASMGTGFGAGLGLSATAESKSEQ